MGRHSLLLRSMSAPCNTARHCLVRQSSCCPIASVINFKVLWLNQTLWVGFLVAAERECQLKQWQELARAINAKISFGRGEPILIEPANPSLSISVSNLCFDKLLTCDLLV